MIRDFTTGKTKFVQLLINSPDQRGGTKTIRGGLTKKSALFEAKKHPDYLIIDILDSKESLEDHNNVF